MGVAPIPPSKIGYANSPYQCMVFCYATYGSPWGAGGYTATPMAGQNICYRFPEPIYYNTPVAVLIISSPSCFRCDCH